MAARARATMTWMLGGLMMAAPGPTAKLVAQPLRSPATSIPAGGEWERFLRARQLTGSVPVRPWSIRAFGPLEIDALRPAVGDTWSNRMLVATHRAGPIEWQSMPLRVGTIVNSTFPYGMNDGPLWAGRGVTASVEGGIAARLGFMWLTLDPMLFVAQNAGFDLAPPSVADPNPFLNPTFSGSIDLPQRFGNGSYSRITAGESRLRAEIGIVGAGFSTAGQVWGPAVESPLILGNNAGGFPHAFLQTSHPLDLRIMTIHGRIVWGQVTQSGYGPAGSENNHFVTGAIGALSAPAFPGLELGAIRFFHTPAPRNGLLHAPFLKVFEGILKTSLATPSNPGGDAPADNQLASVFARWVLPSSGLEVYGEYGREDHNWNLRDFWQEIDHDAGFLLGFQRAWTRSDSSLMVLRGEHLNTRISHLQPVRLQAPWYVHGIRTEGHTQRGQVLGAVGAFGGGGTTLALDRYSSAGRTTLRWDRTMRAEDLVAFRLPNATNADVMHAVGVERVRFLKAGEVSIALTAVWELNRNFGGDDFNLNTSIYYRIFP